MFVAALHTPGKLPLEWTLLALLYCYRNAGITDTLPRMLLQPVKVQTRIVRLVQQAPYPLNHLPGLSEKIPETSNFPK